MGKLKSAIVPIILIGLAPLLVVVIIFGGAFVAIEEISNTKGIMDETGGLRGSTKVNTVWSGVYYERFANQSYYAVVDEPKNDTDEYSGLSFKDIKGRDKLDNTKVFQGGTEEWHDQKVEDINNREKQLTLSSGALSVLDKSLNNGYKNPGQFIRPVLGSCTRDYAAFIASECEDEEGNKHACTLRDCLLTDSDGELLLKTAESTAYVKDDGVGDISEDDVRNAANGTTFSKKSDSKMSGKWDWGLGSVLHYEGYYQPSRVNNYKIRELAVFCEDTTTFKQCQRVGDVVMIKDPTPADITNALGKYNGENGGKMYKPANSFYYKDWIDGYKKIKNNDNIGKIYTDKKNGEYLAYGIDIKDNMAEPLISTGVPVTEIKYVIDEALTYAGPVSNNVSYQWIKQADAEHTQRFTYNFEKKEGYTDKEHVNAQVIPGDDTFHDMDSVKANKTVYYNGKLINTLETYPADAEFNWVEAWIEKVNVPKYNIYIVSPTGVETALGTKDAPEGEPCGGNKGREYKCYRDVSVVEEIYHPAHYEYNGQPITDPTSKAFENKGSYTFGAYFQATLHSYKKGDLQSYSAYYASDAPDTSKTIGSAYIKEYIDNYVSFNNLEAPSAHFGCYSTNKTVDDIMNEDETFNEAEMDALTVNSTTSLFIPLNSCPADKFAYSNSHGFATKAFQWGDLPELQYAYMAGVFGLTPQGEIADALVDQNKIKNFIGSAEDSRYDDVVSRYKNEIKKYSSLYGIDGKLLAILAAEYQSSNSGVDYAKNPVNAPLNEELIAYQMGYRGTATELSGGQQSIDKNKVTIVDLINSWIDRFFNGFGTKLSTSNISSISSGAIEKFNASTDTKLTDAEKSFKAGAMRLQALSNKYKNNIPMVITAYEYGEEFTDAVIKVYSEQMGVSVDEAINNTSDTAWANFRKEVAENTEKYPEATSKSNWNSPIEELDDYEFVESVLSRLKSSGIYNQTIDAYFNTTKDDKNNSDYNQHTFKIWYTGTIFDSLDKIVDVEANSNSSLISNAVNRITKGKAYKNENDPTFSKIWKDLSLNRESYDKDLYTFGNIGEKDPDKAMIIKADYEGETAKKLIQDMFRFGTGQTSTEINQNEDEFWESLFSQTMGNSGNKWNSRIELETIFGEPTDKKLAYSDFGVNVITKKPFGRNLNEFGKEYYSISTTYQTISEQEEILNAPFDGEVTSKRANPDGTTLMELKFTTYNDKEVTMIFDYCGDALVEEGSTFKAGEGIIKSNTDGTFTVRFLVDGKDNNFDFVLNTINFNNFGLGDADQQVENWDEILGVFDFDNQEYQNFDQHEMDESWEYIEMGKMDEFLNSYAQGEGGYWDVLQGADAQAVWNAINSKLQELGAPASAGLQYQCTTFARGWFAMTYGVDLPTGGMGHAWERANSLINAGTYAGHTWSRGSVPKSGAIISRFTTSPYGHVFGIDKAEEINGEVWVTFSDGNVGTNHGVRVQKKVRWSEWLSQNGGEANIVIANPS